MNPFGVQSDARFDHMSLLDLNDDGLTAIADLVSRPDVCSVACYYRDPPLWEIFLAEQVTAPPYISIEMNHRSGDKDIELLRELGYRRFKIVSQATLAQPNSLLTTLGCALPTRLGSILQRKLRSLVGVDRVGSWVFKVGSSGPFAEDTPGSWHDVQWAQRRWKFLHNLDRRYAAKGLGDWFDVHAAKD